MEELTDAERGRLFTAMLEYARTGEAPKLGGNERYIWGTVRKIIDGQREAYAHQCEVNKTNRHESSRLVTNRHESSQEQEKEQETKKETLSKDSAKKERFTPPTVEEVRAYCSQRGNKIDPQRFVDYYTATKWMRGGGVKISDWRACVRTWEQRDGQAPARGRVNRATAYEQNPIPQEAVDRMTVDFSGG